MKRANISTLARVSELELLFAKLSALFKTGQVRRRVANRDSRPLIVKPDLFLVPLGPNSDVVSEALLQAAAAQDWTSALRKAINRSSVVLALCVRAASGASLDALFSADTDGPGFNDACDSLDEFRANSDRGGFDVIKVAHHGSLDSHQGSTACERTKPGERLAVICCNGENTKLPDCVVLSAYPDNGQSRYDTGG